MARIRVLIADDHAIVREGVRALLKLSDDIDVVGEAANGQEAIEAARERGLGLMGMRERVELFGGTLELDSAPGSGTRVAVSVPAVQEVGDEQHPGPDRG